MYLYLCIYIHTHIYIYICILQYSENAVLRPARNHVKCILCEDLGLWHLWVSDGLVSGLVCWVPVHGLGFTV